MKPQGRYRLMGSDETRGRGQVSQSWLMSHLSPPSWLPRRGLIHLVVVLSLGSATAAAPRRAPTAKVPIRLASRGVGPKRPTPPARSAASADAGLPAGARAPHPELYEKAALEIPQLKSADQAGQVTAALQRLKGVQTAIIDANTRLAVVDYDPKLTSLTRILLTCAEAGVTANEYRVELRFPKPVKLKGG